MKLLSKIILFSLAIIFSNNTYGQDSLKILSYNIQGMKPNTQAGFRLSHIIAEIKNLDPDIIALQEINQAVSGNGSDNQGMAITNALSEHFGIEYHYYQQFTHLSWDNKFREYIGIISKHPVEEKGFFQLVTGVFPRKVVWNYIETPLGKINFFSTHLSFNSSSVRAAQTKQIDPYVKDIEDNYPSANAILCGDFNDQPNAGSITYLTNKAYFDSFKENNPGLSGFTVPSNAPNARIDYIFYTNPNDLIPASTQTVMEGPFVSNLYRSDHLGVLSIFKAKPNATVTIHSQKANSLFKLLAGHTNPYQSDSLIDYELFYPNLVKISLFNELGQEVLILNNSKLPAGKHHVRFNTANFKTQVLFLKIEVNGLSEVKQLVIVK